jgi:hypothetical protein
VVAEATTAAAARPWARNRHVRPGSRRSPRAWRSFVGVVARAEGRPFGSLEGAPGLVGGKSPPPRLGGAFSFMALPARSLIADERAEPVSSGFAGRVILRGPSGHFVGVRPRPSGHNQWTTTSPGVPASAMRRGCGPGSTRLTPRSPGCEARPSACERSNARPPRFTNPRHRSPTLPHRPTTLGVRGAGRRSGQPVCRPRLGRRRRLAAGLAHDLDERFDQRPVRRGLGPVGQVERVFEPRPNVAV